ncbi:MAG: type II toxin-antitoxin system death-on-curing family toxin [Pseudomonadota bacterium]|uniref:type II toxin-antitoxin system death-on-curing family toxin n=1 Tax=Gallaecimonas pentaromativorans TaxID=584787 RepID=UPI00067E7770|nr:type II toxin-antitoxin system death-on-curing family toxin [Gallaecimonas pentaromativorans]MED5525430.1 type II toxin-antitoxin system death-on-curing family toxin [Pseudomonadota bacterium]
MKYPTAKDVVAIHDDIINPNELQGQAPDKSIQAVVNRVENRVNYGLVSDVFELAACYAVCIAIGHASNDASKRTAFACMDLILTLMVLSFNMTLLKLAI